jgi:hypothetical protein
VRDPRVRYQQLGFGLAVLGLALLLVYWPAAVGVLVLAALCFLAAVRGWRFPGDAPEPEPRLTRKARRYVEVEPEWSVDFLEPVVGQAVPEPIPFSGIEPALTSFGTIPVRNAGRDPGVDRADLGAELAFYRESGALVYERISARWSNNPFPPLRQRLEPETRRLPVSGEAEPIDVVARVEGDASAWVQTPDAVRGGTRPTLDPATYVVRVRITGAPDEPVAWYRVEVPLMKGLDLRGPIPRPAWAPRPRVRPPAGARAAPRKKSGSSQP